MKQRIGILTGGGDCPGLNAVIRGIIKSATTNHNIEVVGIYDGYLGLMEKRACELPLANASGLLTQGGTILRTSNRANPFKFRAEKDGPIVDVSDGCVDFYHELKLNALVCIGGDGTLSIAGHLAEKGINVIGVPKTIDKDVACTDETFGFDSARAMATDAIDRLHSTAYAHQRVMIVEVMGRNAGWLALESCIAGGGDIAILPEIPYRMDSIIAAVERRRLQDKRFSIVVVAEGAAPAGGFQTFYRSVPDVDRPQRLGGVSRIISEQIESSTGIECRNAILGHLQRGGTPTPHDRLLATRFGVKVVEMFLSKQFNQMVAIRNNEMCSSPISDVVERQKKVPLDSPLIAVARAVGTSFADEVTR